VYLIDINAQSREMYVHWVIGNNAVYLSRFTKTREISARNILLCIKL